MNRRALNLLCVCGVLFLAACRQPDGPLPIETEDDPNRLVDVTRDLLNMAGGDANAPQEFADDVKVWGTTSSAPWEEGDELARRLAAALKGKDLSEQSAAQLARQIWLAAAGRQLSSRQVGRLQTDIRMLLVSVGVAEDAADSVAEQISEVQDAVTTKRRWWFQLF
jgi:hypothetical protein